MWDEDDKRGMEEWTNLIERGCLRHGNDCTYTVFSTLEDEIRRHLGALKSLNEEKEKATLEAIMKMKICGFSGPLWQKMQMALLGWRFSSRLVNFI